MSETEPSDAERAIVGGDDIAVRAAIAPVLGGPPGEFASNVTIFSTAASSPD